VGISYAALAFYLATLVVGLLAWLLVGETQVYSLLFLVVALGMGSSGRSGSVLYSATVHVNAQTLSRRVCLLLSIYLGFWMVASLLHAEENS